MYHPWRHLRTLVDWTLHWTTSGPIGHVDYCTRQISLRDQLQAERRCTLAHELAHIERGPSQDPCEESIVEQIAARRLISLDDLGRALAWSLDPVEVAEMLWVDQATLQVRLEHLHPVELAYLRDRTEHHRSAP